MSALYIHLHMPCSQTEHQRCVLQVALHDQVGGCQNFWRAKPEYVQQYDLATVIPQDVQEVLAVARARQRPKRGGTSSALTLCV